ncbi:MAG: hypothetical protein JNL08_01955 [Planctomycetes bacterium]|nr:hypothetical protein [Planctomycetota bacterium]
MDHDAYESCESAACAAADLAARLNAELALASWRLAQAERNLQAATAAAHRAQQPIPFPVFEQRLACRQQVRLLRRVLGGLPQGGDHAASA